jgi:hypothetical protein
MAACRQDCPPHILTPRQPRCLRRKLLFDDFGKLTVFLSKAQNAAGSRISMRLTSKQGIDKRRDSGAGEENQ